jgi:nucleolar protein 6
MSRTKPERKAEKAEKKRKRQEEETDDVAKKPKKSKKSENDQDATPSDEPIAEQTVDKARKSAEKKAKKAEKRKMADSEDKDGSAQATEATISVQTNGVVKVRAEDSTPFQDDVPMLDATEDTESDRKKQRKEEKRKLKKEKKGEKANKSKDTSEADVVLSEVATTSTQEQNGVTEEHVAQTNGTDVDDKAARKEAKKAKKEKKEKKKSKPQANGEAVNGENAAEEQPAQTNGVGTAEKQNPEDGDETTEPGRKGRFIVFVGMFSQLKQLLHYH